MDKGYLAIAISLCILIGCKPKINPDSNLKWGHSSNQSGMSLINLLPNTSITICGAEAPLVSWAITAWAAIIKRDKYLSIDKNCDRNVDVKIYLHDKGSPRSIAECNSSDVAAANTPSRSIMFCVNAGDFVSGTQITRDIFTRVVLHEVGHLWGLCDQISNQSLCDPIHRSSSIGHGVMSYDDIANWNFKDDDIAGIENLAVREDIPANAEWKMLSLSLK